MSFVCTLHVVQALLRRMAVLGVLLFFALVSPVMMLFAFVVAAVSPVIADGLVDVRRSLRK